MSIVELQKPTHEDCPHMHPAGGCGCAIYADRPATCRDWHCMWVAGEAGTEDDRPDKIGGFLWRQHGTPFGEIIVLDAVEAGSISPRLIAIAEAESKARNMLVYLRNGKVSRRWFGPAHLMERVDGYEIREHDFPDGPGAEAPPMEKDAG